MPHAAAASCILLFPTRLQCSTHICYALVLTLMIRFGFEHVEIFSHFVFHFFCVRVAICGKSMFCLMQSIVWKIF